MAKAICYFATCKKHQQFDPYNQKILEEEAKKRFEEQVKVDKEILKKSFKLRYLMLSDMMMGFFT